MIVGMAVLVTVISIEASTITSISAAVTHPRCTFGEIFSPAAKNRLARFVFNRRAAGVIQGVGKFRTHSDHLSMLLAAGASWGIRCHCMTEGKALGSVRRAKCKVYRAKILLHTPTPAEARPIGVCSARLRVPIPSTAQPARFLYPP